MRKNAMPLSDFQNNLQLYGAKAPHLIKRLQFLNASCLEIVKTPEGDENLKDLRLDPPQFLYPEKGLREEQKNLWDSILKENPQTVYMFGLGLGYLFFEAEEWLKNARDHYLIFLEPDLHVIKKFLESPHAERILSHPQVRIEHVQLDPAQENHAVELCVRLSYAFFGLKDTFSALPYYAKALAPIYFWFKDMFDEIRRNSHYHVIAHLFMADKNYRNIYENLFDISSACYFQSLYGKCRDTPAIIVGAGPSIQKNIHLLKDLGQNALLFAGGAAITMLGNNQIIPDLCAVVDPDPPFERFAAHKAFEAPLLFQSRASSQIISLFDGPKVCLPPTGGIPLETWANERLKLDPRTFGSILTVSDVCTRVAALLGCNPIIFVGIDLCYTAGRYYAESVSKAENYEEAQDRIALQDINGNPVFTKSEWKLSAMQIGMIAKEFPSQKFINATEGGIGFEGVPNMPLQEVKQKFLQKGIDNKGTIHTLLQNATPVQTSKADVARIFKELTMSLQKIIVHCGSWQEALQKWTKEIHNEPPYEEELYGRLIHEELSYRVIIKPLWEIFNAVTERNVGEAARDKTPWQKRLLRESHMLTFYKKTAFTHLKILRKLL